MPNNQLPHLNDLQRFTLEVIYRWEFEPFKYLPWCPPEYLENKDDYVGPPEDDPYDIIEDHEITPVPCDLVVETVCQLYPGESENMSIVLEYLARFNFLEFSDNGAADDGFWILSDELCFHITRNPRVIRVIDERKMDVYERLGMEDDPNSLLSHTHRKKSCKLTGQGIDLVKTVKTMLESEKDILNENQTWEVSTTDSSQMVTKGLRIEKASLMAYWNNEQLNINAHADFTVLQTLYDSKNTLVKYLTLIKTLKPTDYSTKVATLYEAPPEVKEAISHIRKALRDVNSNLKIDNVKKKGYRLLLPNE